MSNYGKSETWKIVYALPPAQQNGGMRGVAFVEAQTKSEASSYFKQQYAGQYFVIESITKFNC